MVVKELSRFQAEMHFGYILNSAFDYSVFDV